LSKVAPVIISISTGIGDKYIWIAQQTDYDKDEPNEGKFSSYDRHKMRIKRRKDGPKAERMTRSWLKKVRDFLGDKKICSEGREEAAARRHNKITFPLHHYVIRFPFKCYHPTKPDFGVISG